MKVKLFCLMTWAMAITTSPLMAQTFTTLHGFTSGSGADGNNPGGGVISSGNTLYGAASAGGSSIYGTVFAVNTDELIAASWPLTLPAVANL